MLFSSVNLQCDYDVCDIAIILNVKWNFEMSFFKSNFAVLFVFDRNEVLIVVLTMLMTSCCRVT